MPRTQWSLAQYLAMEEIDEFRNEFVDGEIYAMSGASLNHNRIEQNIAFALRACADAKGCEVFTEGARLAVRADRFYPDIVMVCGPVQTAEDDPAAITNPKVIIEIQSPSTSNYDRNVKFRKYLQIPTCEQYLIVAQDKMQVEVFRKRDGQWMMPETPITDGELEICGCMVSLKDMYQRVQFSADN